MKRHYPITFLLTLIIYGALAVAIYGISQMSKPQKEVTLKPVNVNLAMFQQPQPEPIVEPIKTPEPIPEPKVEPQIKPKIEPKVQPKIEPKPIPKPLPKPKPVEQPKPQPPKETQDKPKPVVKPIEKPQPKVVEKPVVQLPKPAPIVEKPQPTPVQPQYSTAQIATAEERYLTDLAHQFALYAQDTYPSRAKRRHWEGVVVMSFTLHADGSMHNISVISSSDYSVLDDAALSIIHDKMQKTFKPFPTESPRKTWQIQVPIEYRLL